MIHNVVGWTRSAVGVSSTVVAPAALSAAARPIVTAPIWLLCCDGSGIKTRLVPYTSPPADMFSMTSFPPVPRTEPGTLLIFVYAWPANPVLVTADGVDCRNASD